MAYYRVLVVDDNREVRRMVAASIKTLGSEIDVLDVPSAEEGMYISTSLPLDLVILDHRLPGMTGIEMVSQLKRRKPEMKIILVSGVEDETIRKQISQAEVEAYFYKPIDISSFLEAVKRTLFPARIDTIVIPEKKAQTGKLPAEKPELPKPQDISQAFNESRHLYPFALLERMTALKLQAKADGALIVSLDGRILAEVGDDTLLVSDAALLTSLRQACLDNLKVLQAFPGSDSECMQYFMSAKQCIYLTPIGTKHALLVMITKRIMADKLGMVDRAIHLAAQDIRNLLADVDADQKSALKETSLSVDELPATVNVDQQTLVGVEGILAGAFKIDSQQQVENFWQALENNGELEISPGDDSFSFDQARDMGLIPDQK